MITLTIKLTVNPDPWVPGGNGEYAVELKRDGNQVAGTHTGTYTDKPVTGPPRGTIKSGA
jgi:hypothetical protein